MKERKFGAAILLFLVLGCTPDQSPAAASAVDAPVRLIFDADMDTDCDDAGEGDAEEWIFPVAARFPGAHS